jgi:hypothetical protein
MAKANFSDDVKRDAVAQIPDWQPGGLYIFVVNCIASYTVSAYG